MPTTRPRHQITETPAVQDAIEVALHRWPGASRSRALLHLIEAGATAVRADMVASSSRLEEGLETLATRWGGVVTVERLEDLREDA